MHDVTVHERGGMSWLWPKTDQKLIQVFDQVSDIQLILHHVAGRCVCVQAGGACGVWPLEFAKHFESVITFEPDPTNFHCLVWNCNKNKRIACFNAGLYNENCMASMRLHESEEWNCGAYYIDPNGGEIELKQIDSLELTACDLIQLDVEGYELEALQGAKETIEKFSPVVVIEEKALPQFPERQYLARKHLELIGYREVASAHRDVIFRRFL